MPNFKKLAKAYEKDAVNALKGFIKKQSVYDASSVKEGAPYGEGVKSALDYAAKLGKDLGFKVDYCDGYATELSIGEESGTLVGVYAHADVVPVSGKWDNPPFEGKIIGEGKEAMMIGRGTSDDKGPLIAAIYAAKLLKENNLISDYRIRIVAGGDEERGSSCLEHYFHALKKPASDFGFTPDAEFPLIYGEKAMNPSRLAVNVNLDPIIAIDGGVVSNAVCDKLIVTVPTDKKLAAFIKEMKVECDVAEVGPIMILTFKGKSAHGSTPELGINASVNAFKVLGTFYKNSFLVNLAKVIEDPNGASWGGYDNSPELKETTYNYGLIKYDGKKLTVSVDFRYGENCKYEECLKKLEEASKMQIEWTLHRDHLLFDKDSPLVSTLMKAYKRETLKLFDKPMTIGGGTYAKEAPNCVAFGSAFKGHEGNIHQANEYIYLDDLYKQIAIYADAIYSLGQLKK